MVFKGRRDGWFSLAGFSMFFVREGPEGALVQHWGGFVHTAQQRISLSHASSELLTGAVLWHTFDRCRPSLGLWKRSSGSSSGSNNNNHNDHNNNRQRAAFHLVVEDQRDKESRHGRRHDGEDEGRQLGAGAVKLERQVDVQQGGCRGGVVALFRAGGDRASEGCFRKAQQKGRMAERGTSTENGSANGCIRAMVTLLTYWLVSSSWRS